MARFDPAPRFTGARLLAGTFAGLVGGLAFGVLMTLPAVLGSPAFDGVGMMTLLSRLVGTEHLGVLWGMHAIASALFGLLFATVVSPTTPRRAVMLGLAWGALLWLVNVVVLLPLLAGVPFGFGASAAYNLLGHLAYGGALGVAYAAFFREEVGYIRDHPKAGRAAP